MKWMAAICLLAICTLAPARAAELEDRDPTFVAGRAALEDGLYDIAEGKFKDYIDKTVFRGKRALGSLYLLQALHAQGKYAEAIQWLQDHPAWVEDTEAEGGLTYWLAKCEAGLSQYDASLEHLKDFERRFDGNEFAPEALRLRAEDYRKLNQGDLALGVYAEFQRKFSRDSAAPANLLDWAGLLIAQKKSDEAEKILRTAVTDYAASDVTQQARLMLGQLLAERKDWSEMEGIIGVLITASNAPPDQRASALFLRATALEAATNLTAAAAACADGIAIARDPALQVHGRVLRSRVLDRTGDREGAIQLLDEAIAAFPGLAELEVAQINLADLLLADHQYEKALDEYQKYLEAFSDAPDLNRALTGKSWCLWDLGRYAESAAAFEKAYGVLTNETDRESALVKVADSYFANGQFKLAQDKYVVAKDTFIHSPHLPDMLMQIAECDARLKRYREADGGLRYIVDQFPDREVAERALLRLAGLKEERGEWEDAAKVYDDLMLMYPKSLRWPEALQGRGLARYHAGLFTSARSDFEVLLEKFPSTAWAERANFLRAWCFYMEGDSKQALRIASDFLDKFPDSVWAADVLFWSGEHFFNSGDPDKARHIFEDIVKRFPDSKVAPDALYWAGRTAFQQNEYRQALGYYNDLTKKYPTSPRVAEARFAQGDALTELGEFSGAIIAFDEVIKRFPGSVLADLALGRKGDCQFTLGGDKPARMQEALTSYRALFDSPTVSPNLKLQAEYKMARCYEKMDRRAEALEHYMNVVYDWLNSREMGRDLDEVWFTRAAFNAAALKEADGAAKEAARIYQRVVDAGVPAGADAEKRIEKLRAAL